MKTNLICKRTLMLCVAFTAAIGVTLWIPWYYSICINSDGDRALLKSMQDSEQSPIVWTKFTNDSLKKTFRKKRIAVVWLGFSFSFPAHTFEKFLGSALHNVDYYELEVDWGKQRQSPFYNKFGFPKDGGLIVATSDGETRCYTIDDGEIGSIRHFLHELVNSVQENPMNSVGSKE